MEELVNTIAIKTGLTPEISKTVVIMVLDFVKKKLPAPLAGKIDALLDDNSPAAVLGGLFG
jgi:hypothetical protein